MLADAVDDAADRPRQDDRPAPSVDRGVGVWIARRAVITQLASFGPHPEVGRGVGVGLDQTLAVHAQLVVDVEGARRGASNAQCVSWSDWFLPTLPEAGACGAETDCWSTGRAGRPGKKGRKGSGHYQQ